jgi:hypothetical protein
MLIDILSKSSKNVITITNGSLGLKIHNKQRMINTSLTNTLLKTSPSHRNIRVRERQRMPLESGMISTKSSGTTPMNVAKNNNWW